MCVAESLMRPIESSMTPKFISMSVSFVRDLHSFVSSRGQLVGQVPPLPKANLFYCSLKRLHNLEFRRMLLTLIAIPILE